MLQTRVSWEGKEGGREKKRRKQANTEGRGAKTVIRRLNTSFERARFCFLEFQFYVINKRHT